MPCVVITRDGWGDVLLFGTKKEALLHPVTHPGLDAVADCPEDLTDLYNNLEWGRLMRLAGVWDKQVEDAISTLRGPEERHVRRTTSIRVWNGLLAMASPPPQTYEDLCVMVAQNRTMPTRGYNAMSEAQTDEEAKKGYRSRMDPETKISFLKDAEGKRYGADNNPYRAGRLERFAVLKEGMTIGEAEALGIKAENLKVFVKDERIQLIAP